MVKRLICLLVLMLVPALALAAPQTPYDTDVMLYYPRLDQSQQALFDLIYRAAAAGEESVELPEGTPYDQACLVMELLQLDCPELCSLDTQYTVTYLQNKPQEAVRLNLTYVLPAECNARVVEIARGMADQAYGDEFQREWILHDMLCRQTCYDLEAPNCHSAWGALAEGRAVCDGYARAMALLLRFSGIPCGVVRGVALETGANHAWNLARIDGAWTWLDVTNNDQAAMISYFYFNLSDRWMKKSYAPETEIALPACGDESVAWHARTWRWVQRAEDMELHIFNNFRNHVRDGAMFNLKFEQLEDYLAFRDDVTGWAKRYNEAWDPDAYGAISTYYSDQQQCVAVQLAP